VAGVGFSREVLSVSSRGRSLLAWKLQKGRSFTCQKGDPEAAGPQPGNIIRDNGDTQKQNKPCPSAGLRDSRCAR